jgi:hypothetical protein
MWQLRQFQSQVNQLTGNNPKPVAPYSGYAGDGGIGFPSNRDHVDGVLTANPARRANAAIDGIFKSLTGQTTLPTSTGEYVQSLVDTMNKRKEEQKWQKKVPQMNRGNQNWMQNLMNTVNLKPKTGI